MKKLAYILCLVSSASFATEIQFGFKSPSFNGVGYSSHVLTIENLEATRKQKIFDDRKSAAEKAASDAKNTNLAKFLNNLESRIYATISQNIASELFKDNGNTSGAFDIQGNHLQWVSDGSTITLRITDPGGSVTEVVVPYGSMAW
jgi:Type VIII secretion system (T8SS), CsgF protein